MTSRHAAASLWYWLPLTRYSILCESTLADVAGLQGRVGHWDLDAHDADLMCIGTAVAGNHGSFVAALD
jgi:hypothetical protein